jgi:hypothetical protein
MSRKTQYYPFKGGINTEDPALSLPAGELIDGYNYEPVTQGGYRRINGFERYDGHPLASLATYYTLPFDTGVSEPTIGDTIEGDTSSAEAILLEVVLTSGTWLGGDAAGTLVLLLLSGTFQDAEDLLVSASTIATTTGAATLRGEADTDLDTVYVRAAIEATRDLAAAVPGSGPLRGVFMFNGVTYAFRNAADGLSCVLYESSAAGWVPVGMDHELQFDSGSKVIAVGDTIVGKISGATAEVTHLHVDSGDWTTNNAAGFIYYNPDTLTGTFQNGEIIRVGVLDSATLIADPREEVFLPDGTFETIQHNFYGASNLNMVYGVDGKNLAWSFDGADVKFIHTGMVVDTPTHIHAHKQHLFLSFPGGSVQHSSPGTPFVWSPITGASEIAIGQECVGFIGVPGEAMAIFGRNSTHILNGTNVTDWVLNTLNDEAGAIEWSIQRFNQPIYLDDRGITSLSATDAYGDFRSKTLSQKVQKIIKQAVTTMVASLRIREKDQYRLFLSDGRIIVFGFDAGKMIGVTVLNYGVQMVVTASVENALGEEILLAGDEDGFVYRLDSGTSFDGNPVEAWIRPIFNHFGTPEHKKRFYKAVLEIDADENLELTFLPDYGYGNPNLPSAVEGTVDAPGGGGIWDSPDTNWGEFYWDSQLISSAEGYIDGVGNNLSLFIRSVGTYEKPHTIQGAIIHFSTRGVNR